MKACGTVYTVVFRIWRGGLTRAERGRWTNGGGTRLRRVWGCGMLGVLCGLDVAFRACFEDRIRLEWNASMTGGIGPLLLRVFVVVIQFSTAVCK